MEHHAVPGGFDVHAFFAAMDERRRREGLSWSWVAAQMWELSADLNARHERHPIAASTIATMPRHRDTAASTRW